MQYTKDHTIKTIAVPHVPGVNCRFIEYRPLRALSVGIQTSLCGDKSVTISFIAAVIRPTSNPCCLSFFLVEDEMTLENVPASMHYLGKTETGMHVWTSVERAE